METQFIGVDAGRGYLKGYTEYKGKAKEFKCKSIIGDGREINYFSTYENPIYLEINGEEIFAGELAEKESFNAIQNYSDDKTSDVAKKLMYVILNELAESSEVKICLGVPHKTFNQNTLETVLRAYKGTTVTIKDLITKNIKRITIMDITIFRESDAALMYVINNHKDRVQLMNKKVGILTTGFRTSEMSYFDKSLKYNDKLSKTMEVGNRTVLDIIRNQLSHEGIIKDLNEIDTEEEYLPMKKKCYEFLLQKLNQEVEMSWVNYKEMKIFIAGGTVLQFENIPDKFEIVPDVQMVTAKGLFKIAEKRLK